MVGAYCSVNPQTRWCAPKVKGAIKLKDPVGLGDLEAAAHTGRTSRTRLGQWLNQKLDAGRFQLGHRTRLSTFFVCLEAFIANRQPTKKGKAVLCSHSV